MRSIRSVLVLSVGASSLFLPPLPGQSSAKGPAHAIHTLRQPRLSESEKAAQLLNRFTFGSRPGDLDAVLKIGVESWFEQQLDPSSIPDATLDRRLQDYPALQLTSAQTVLDFPTSQRLRQIADGKQPYPQDPVLLSLYQVLETKYLRQQQARTSGQADKLRPAEKEVQKKQDQGAALQLAEQALGLPKTERMSAILKLTVDQRILLADDTPDVQKKMLVADFNPREQEIFAAMSGGSDAVQVVDGELQQAKVLRAILSERQLQEVMTDFWFNHFNVFLHKETDQIYTPAYVRDAIRPHTLGKFRDLLLATAQHPAMLVYLDNWQSIGPGSQAADRTKAAQKARRGVNENYGREVMELHTAGVNGGYSQADVTSLAEILTGWTIDKPQQGGGFVFAPGKHEPGDKTWFGQTITGRSGEDGLQEGVEALSWLAAQPQTAHFISYKIAQRFVADDPPPSLVDRMAQSFLASDGDIKQVLRTMERSPEFWSRRNFRNKVKTPLEFVASAFRATETAPTNPAAVVNELKTMGEPLYQMQPPTGYPTAAGYWMNSAALVDRLNFSLSLISGKLGNIPFDAPRLLASGLLARQPQAASSLMRRIAIQRSAGVSPSGREEAVSLLEQSVIGGDVSPKTTSLILKQIAADGTGDSPSNSTQLLNTTAALILGSPEFQLK